MRTEEASIIPKPSDAGPRVVIAHDFAETYGGAERVLAATAEVFPDAPVWAISGRQNVADRMGIGNRFHAVVPENETFLRHYRLLAPLYPAIVRHRLLPPAEVLLTSSYAFAHGFATRNAAPQVCYCYSPLRAIWSMTGDYANRLMSGPIRSLAFRTLVAAARRADRSASNRVTQYVSESHHVADQVRRAYGRDSLVIHPPVDCKLFRPSQEPGHDGFYLFCGRLIEPYKRPGMVIDAFRSLPDRLVVANDGPAYRELKAQASSNVEFVGKVGEEELVSLMQRCAASIFPSLDDFGLIPVETMACGRPVIAFAGGGALETMVAGVTGEFFRDPTASALRSAIEDFDPDAYDTHAIRSHAEAWDLPRFQDAIRRVVTDTAGLSVRAPRATS